MVKKRQMITEMLIGLGIASCVAGVLGFGAVQQYRTSQNYPLEPIHKSKIVTTDLNKDNNSELVYVSKAPQNKILPPDYNYKIVIEESSASIGSKKHTLDKVFTMKDNTGENISFQIMDSNKDGLDDIRVRAENYLGIFENKGNFKFEEKVIYKK